MYEEIKKYRKVYTKRESSYVREVVKCHKLQYACQFTFQKRNVEMENNFQ